MDDRYERQLVMPSIGEKGQARLGDARVLVVGAGGLGSPILLYLAAAGVGTLGIAENDRVSLSNLNRQVLYATADIERSKVMSAVRRIRALNPAVRAVPHEERVLRDNGVQLVAAYSLVVDASDNLETKSLLNELCVDAGIPLVWAAVTRWEGQLGAYVPGRGCRACVFPELPEPGAMPSPADLGVVGAAAGVVGALEAVEALKLLLGVGDTLAGKLALWDGLHGSYDVVRFDRNPHCPVCGVND